MIQTLFSIDAFTTKVKDWKKKKTRIKKYVKDFKYYRRPNTSFSTTRFGTSSLGLTDKLYEIFADELHLFGTECNFKKLYITDSWVINYKKGDYQVAHHHGKSMYTGILYLNLDKKQETATYIAPWSDEMSKQTKLTQIECEEGTLVIFPGHLLHYVNPNLLDKDRVVISFDLDCDEQD